MKSPEQIRDKYYPSLKNAGIIVYYGRFFTPRIFGFRFFQFRSQYFRKPSADRETVTTTLSENEMLSKTLHRIFLILYLQFAFYWATIAAGMYDNYYYAVPGTLQANFSSIFSQ